MSFKVTWKTHVVCFGIATLISLLFWDTANVIVENFIKQGLFSYPRKLILVNFYVSILTLIIPIVAVHEALHGIAYIVFGGEVRYGFKGIYAYTMEVSEKPIHRVKFLVVLLLPVTVISLFTLLLPLWLGGMVFFLNLLGSSGDLLMALSLIKLDSASGIVDRKYGFDVVEH